MPGFENLGKMTLETIANCKYREELTSQKCRECSEGYLLKADDGTCIEAASVSSTHPNCKTLTTVSDKLVCETCEETHVIDSNTNMCSIATNCMKMQKMDEIFTIGTPNCDLCNEGFKPHETEFNLCVPIDEADTCLQYTPDNFCIKCKDSTLMPFMFTDVKSGNSYHICVDFDTSDFPFIKENNYGLVGILDDPQDKSMIAYSQLDRNGNINRLTAGLPIAGYPNKTICMALPTDPNCEEPYGPACFKCKSEFFFDMDTKKCLEGTITGCSSYADKDNCETCKEGHFKNAQNKCVERTAQNCASVIPTSNECETCNEGYYLKQNNGDCNADAANCDQCLAYTKNAGCKEMDENDDVCKKCEDDHYYDSTNTVCVRRTILNCGGYEKEEDKCKSCDESKHFFKEDTGECVAPTNVDNCSEYNAAINKCSACSDNFFLDAGDNECISNPDGIPGCKQYSSRTTCSGCGEDMYVKDNKCVLAETKVEGCYSYKEDGKCLKCQSTHLIVGDTCSEILNTSCATWKDVDNCESCASNKVLKKVSEKDQCVSLTISNCDQGEMSGEDMICLKCASGKLPSADKKSCVSPDTAIEGCQDYMQSSSKESPKCERCEERKLLNVSQTECTTSEILKEGKCLHAQVLKENKCMYCGVGKMFEDGNCVSCGGEGCLACDVTDSEKCFVCLPQYSMKTKGVCTLTYPDVKPISVSILNAFYMGIMMMFILGRSE
jgi:hypothetical protein